MMPSISSKGMEVFISSSPSPSLLRSGIKGEEESCSFEESHDKEKCKLVIERMAFEDHGSNLFSTQDVAIQRRRSPYLTSKSSGRRSRSGGARQDVRL